MPFVRSLLVMALLPLLASCITRSLWTVDGASWTPEEGWEIREYQFGKDEGPDDALAGLLLRIALTPATLVLDGITYPLQEWVFDSDGEEGDAPNESGPESRRTRYLIDAAKPNDYRAH